MIILNSPTIGKFYDKKYSNSKYSIDDILKVIYYVLKTGISYRNIISHIKWQTIYWNFKRFVANNIFKKLYNKIRKKIY